MKASTTLFVSTLALAGAAVFASPALARQSEHPPAPETQPFVSTLSRAEVAAEAARALRAGEILVGEFGPARNDQLGRSTVAKSRAQVVAELAEARRAGLTGQRWDENGLAAVDDALRHSHADAGTRMAAVRGAALR